MKKKDRAVSFEKHANKKLVNVFLASWFCGTIFNGRFSAGLNPLSPGDLRRIAEYMERPKKRGRGIVHRTENY